MCSPGGAERFLVWARRCEASLHEDAAFARECMQESFERAGMADVLPVFRKFVSTAHGMRALSALAPTTGAAAAMLALGEVAEALRHSGGRIRRWDEINRGTFATAGS